MDWLKQIEIVLFDLDGTLYQDDSFSEHYLQLLLNGTEHEAELPALKEELVRLLNGQHHCSIGDWYHPGLNMWMRPADERVEAFDWNGVQTSPDHEALEGSRNQLIYAGDAWSLVSIMANRLQIPEEKRKHAFLQVREDMLAGLSGFDRHRELFETIEGLTGVRAKMLLTNSPADTGRDFVGALGCADMFDDIRYGAGKPAGVERFALELMAKLNLQPHNIMTIGDHAWNDLYPIRKLGGRTVWISPYTSSESAAWDVSVSNLDELTLLLKQLQQAKVTAA